MQLCIGLDYVIHTCGLTANQKPRLQVSREPGYQSNDGQRKLFDPS